jgi:hypothetical protein
MNKICLNCKKEFWANHTTNVCCSQKCAHNLKKKRMNFECLVCKKIFEDKSALKRKTCSFECAAKYLSIIHKGKRLWKHRNIKPLSIFKCRFCGKEKKIATCRFSYGEGKFCSRKCSNMAQSRFGENNVNWRGGISFEPYAPDFTRILKNRIKDKFNHNCFECGFSENRLGYGLRIHHIDYNKKNSLENNLIPLCRSCHSKTNFKRSDWINYFKNKLVGVKCPEL